MKSQSGPGGYFFLGGLFSAMFFGLGFPPASHRLIPWFALIPFLYSLHRNREKPFARLFHGACFGIALATWFLLPIFRALFSPTADARNMIPTDEALSVSAIAWLGLVVPWCLFALWSGVVVRSRNLWIVLFGLPLLWTGIEYFRIECLPMCFPHLALGSSFSTAHPETRLAEYVGQHGLSFLACLVSTALFLCLREGSWRRQIALFALSLGTMFLATSGLLIREEAQGDPESKTSIALVQFSSSTDSDALRSILDLASSLVREPPSLVLFPEGTLPGRQLENGAARSALRNFCREHRTAILMGLRGSLVFIDRDGEVGDSIEASGGWSLDPKLPAGTGPRILEIDGLRCGVGVEADFYRPGSIRRLTNDGAGVLLCGSGEAKSWGPDWALLHGRMAALRAIENGRWLFRATRGGISAVVSPEGQAAIHAAPGLGWGAVEAASPLERSTFFARFGWILGPLSLAAAGCIAAANLLASLLAWRQKPISDEASS